MQVSLLEPAFFGSFSAHLNVLMRTKKKITSVFFTALPESVLQKQRPHSKEIKFGGIKNPDCLRESPTMSQEMCWNVTGVKKQVAMLQGHIDPRN